MSEDDEKALGASFKRPASHEIGQSLDSLSVAELADRVELLKSEIIRLEEARRSKQDALSAAAALFKL